MALCKEYGITHSVYMEWEPEDKAKALAFLIEEGQRCQMCGTAAWEWEENRFAYEPVAKHCHGCYLKDTANEDSKNLPGTTVVLESSAAVSEAERRKRWEWEQKLAIDEMEQRQKR